MNWFVGFYAVVRLLLLLDCFWVLDSSFVILLLLLLWGLLMLIIKLCSVTVAIYIFEWLV